MRTMIKRWYLLVVLGVALLLAALPAALGLAGEAEKKLAPAETNQPAETPKKPKESTQAPAAPEKPAAAKKPAGLVGTVVAVVPGSRTLVVNVPRGQDVLRIGAAVTERTKIRAGAAPASFDSLLKEGDRVRIQFRRVATGDEATTVEVLHRSQG